MLTRLLLAFGLLWVAAGAVARADDTVPTPQPTSAPGVVFQPTAAPTADTSPPINTPAPADTPPPIAAETPAVDTSLVPVSKEPSRAAIQPVQPQATESAPPSRSEPQSYQTPVSVSSPHVVPITQTQPQRHFSNSSSSRAATPSSASSPVLAPTVPDQTSAGVSVIDVNAGPTSYAAPSELACHGKSKPDSGPFLVSPYSGWSEINSFLDHDNPDYRLDGKIVLANGLTATASAGQSSDFFPAYWSTALRQYINYDGHNGYDFGISYQPVLAAAAGTVTYADWDGGANQGYGQMILIDHHNGYVTLYGHLSLLEVKKGDKVVAGQEIGISGSTGRSTGPHLHFSVFHNCQVTDPYGWIGRGRDPLLDFDGEKAGYLWLPGHDPLVLNPPPDWPSFALDVNIPADFQGLLGRVARRVPPAERLLLLALPAPRPGELVTSTVALARTESLVTQEAEALTPYLRDLQAQGLIENYQAVPAAGAVWVRGTATAEQLEGLPGVASLAGVQPRDLVAAQSGLAHSILLQVGPQQAPALWPVGFRSALQAWRPVVAISNGHALVTGVALPGQQVIVSLLRRGFPAGVARATADPESGGFVVTIHDHAGNPVSTQPGDVVEVQSGGRTADMQVVSLSVRPREHQVTGKARPGSTVLLVLLDTSGEPMQRIVATADAGAKFLIPVRRVLPAGTLAVASSVDGAGDLESSTAFVPGMQVDEGTATLRGWTVGHAPEVKVERSGRLVFWRKLHPAADGSFQIDLQHLGHPLILHAGDAVTLGSPWHHRRFFVPALAVTLRLEAHQVRIAGPAHVRAHLTFQRVGASEKTLDVLLDKAGRGLIAWPGGPAGVGDVVGAEIVASGGTTVDATAEVRGIVVHEGEAGVSGRARPGSTLSVHVSTPTGRLLGSAVASSNAITGSFAATVHDSAGHPVVIQPGLRVDVRDGSSTMSGTALPIYVTIPVSGASISGRAPPGQEVWLTLSDLQGHSAVHRLKADSAGRVAMRLSGPVLHQIAQVTLAMVPTDGLTIERSLTVPTRQARASTRHHANRKP